MPAFRTNKRETIQTPDRPMGSGGEARVYTVNNDPSIVAKIYTKQIIYGSQLTDLGRRTEQKLTAMIENAPPTKDMDGKVALAWPIDMLYHYGGPNDGLLAGFTMPKIDMGQYQDVLNYYNPSLRTRLNRNFARQGFRVPTEGADLETLLNVIVRNIATILSNIHGLDYVIGDVNESNILVNYEGRVAFVDSDSFQVQDQRNRIVHRSPVGKEDFLSPRVIDLTKETCNLDRCPSGKAKGKHSKEFLCFDREPEDDLFAIAVILFKLLMNGAHPLDNVGGSQTYKDKIANREFPFKHRSLKPPPGSMNRWLQLSANWMNYFGYTFVTDRRYTAEEVLNLGHHLASRGGGNLGQQVTVPYQTNLGGNGNGSSASPAAPPQQSAPGPSSQQQQRPPNPPAPGAATTNSSIPRGPRRTNPAQPAAASPPNPPLPQTVKCPKCDEDNDYQEIFCQKAGFQEPLVARTSACSSCGKDIPINAIYCPQCSAEQYPGQSKDTILGKR